MPHGIVLQLPVAAPYRLNREPARKLSFMSFRPERSGVEESLAFNTLQVSHVLRGACGRHGQTRKVGENDNTLMPRQLAFDRKVGPGCKSGWADLPAIAGLGSGFGPVCIRIPLVTVAEQIGPERRVRRRTDTLQRTCND